MTVASPKTNIYGAQRWYSPEYSTVEVNWLWVLHPHPITYQVIVYAPYRCWYSLNNFKISSGLTADACPANDDDGIYWWLSAKLQYLHCISNGDTAVLDKAIDTFFQLKKGPHMIFAKALAWGLSSQPCKGNWILWPKGTKLDILGEMITKCIIENHKNKKLINACPIKGNLLTWYWNSKYLMHQIQFKIGI